MLAPSPGARNGRKHSVSLLRITHDEKIIISQTRKKVRILFDTLRLNLRRTGNFLSCHFDALDHSEPRLIHPCLDEARNLRPYSLTGSFTNHYISYESNRSRALSEKFVLIPLLASIPLSLVTNIKSSRVNKPWTVSKMVATISMGQYLFKRVAELGNEHVFGVPGDFNRKSIDK